MRIITQEEYCGKLKTNLYIYKNDFTWYFKLAPNISFEKRNLYWELQDLTKNIYMVFYNNPAIFIKTIKFIFKSDNIISDMLSIVGLDEEELELLKLGLDNE